MVLAIKWFNPPHLPGVNLIELLCLWWINLQAVYSARASSTMLALDVASIEFASGLFHQRNVTFALEPALGCNDRIYKWSNPRCTVRNDSQASIGCNGRINKWFNPLPGYCSQKNCCNSWIHKWFIPLGDWYCVDFGMRRLRWRSL